MRVTGCDFGPFGRHCQDMGPFRPYGPFDRFGCGPPRPHFGPPGYHFGPPGHHFGPGPCRHHGPSFGHRGPFFGLGPDFGADSENCCQDCCSPGSRGCGRDPCRRAELAPRGAGGSDSENPRLGPHGPEGRHGPHGRSCGRPCDRSRERSRGQHRPDRPHGREERRDHSRRECHGSPSRHHSRPCDGRDDGEECGAIRLHGHGPGPFGPHFGHHFGPHFGGHFGPHRRPFGPWNRQGPYEYHRCQRNNSDDESGDETERRGRKNRPCGRKNKDQNRDGTILVQRIVVEKDPRCNSV